jgi:hypothetical protein
VNLYAWCSLNVILVEVNTTMVKGQAHCSSLLLLPADFWLTLQVCYELNDIPSSPSLCLPMLTCQAQSPQFHATCCTKLMARPVSVLSFRGIFVLFSIASIFLHSQQAKGRFVSDSFLFLLFACQWTYIS